MNKEELKKQFLLKRLEDPNVEEWEKRTSEDCKIFEF